MGQVFELIAHIDPLSCGIFNDRSLVSGKQGKGLCPDIFGIMRDFSPLTMAMKKLVASIRTALHFFSNGLPSFSFLQD
jgi:hypothetical protein